MTRALMRGIVASLAITVAIGVVEAGLRLQRGEVRFMVREPVRGWQFLPDAEGWSLEESTVWGRINHQGLFDHEHPIAKPADTRRVALLGDSYLASGTLPFEKTFPALLEQSLIECRWKGASRVEVNNFGVPGYGTAQELLTYQFDARRYDPDLVVLAMYLGNDVLNNHQALNPSGAAATFSIVNGALQYASPMPTDDPARDDDPPGLPRHQRIRLWLTKRSRAAALVWEAWSRLRSLQPPPRMLDDRQDLVYRAPSDAIGQTAWAVTDRLVAEVARTVRNDGREFLLVTLPTAQQVDPDPAARRATAVEYGVDSLGYADARIRAVADADGIPMLSLVDGLAAWSERARSNLFGGLSKRVPLGTGHWNEAGNRAVAELVAKQLCAR